MLPLLSMRREVRKRVLVALAVLATVSCGKSAGRGAAEGSGGAAGSQSGRGGTGGAGGAGRAGAGGTDNGGNAGGNAGADEGGAPGSGGTDSAGTAGATGGTEQAGAAGDAGSMSQGGVAGQAGGAGTGGAQGGIGGAAGAPLCDDPDEDAELSGHTTPSTTTGTDGTFTDECDADGNLVEYYCEKAPASGFFCGQPNPDPRCYDLFPTGRVLSRNVDCGGECNAGACASHCPDAGDELTVVTVDHATGAVMFTNLTRPGEYACELDSDWVVGGFDCLSDPTPGISMSPVMQLTGVTLCPIGQNFRVLAGLAGTTDPECDYTCVRTD